MLVQLVLLVKIQHNTTQHTRTHIRQDARAQTYTPMQ